MYFPPPLIQISPKINEHIAGHQYVTPSQCSSQTLNKNLLPMHKIEIGYHNIIPKIIQISNIYLLLSKKMTKLEKNLSKLNVTV